MKRTWQDLVEMLIGAWLIVSPFALGFVSLGDAPAGTAILIGSLVVGIAVVGISMPEYWEEWTQLGLGAALLVSPWVLGYSAAMIATGNAVISGALLMIFAILALLRERNIHHHPPGVAAH
jgi:hypothetical protein